MALMVASGLFPLAPVVFCFQATMAGSVMVTMLEAGSTNVLERSVSVGQVD